MIKCSICGRTMSEMESNNARPVNKGRCCRECNYEYVIPARMLMMQRGVKDIRDTDMFRKFVIEAVVAKAKTA